MLIRLKKKPIIDGFFIDKVSQRWVNEGHSCTFTLTLELEKERKGEIERGRGGWGGMQDNSNKYN